MGTSVEAVSKKTNTKKQVRFVAQIFYWKKSSSRLQNACYHKCNYKK